MVGILLDECMSPRLPSRFNGLGIHAIHIRDRGMLGVQDHSVWQLAQHEMLALCTINGSDFRKLAKRGPHNGLIVVPSGGNVDEQFNWTAAALLQALRSNSNAGLENRYIEVDESSAIVVSEIHDLDPYH